jgi:hypothetical protein
MHRAILTGWLWEEFGGEGGTVASVLKSCDLKHVCKLTVCVIYAFSERWRGTGLVFTAAAALLRHAGCRCVPGQWYKATQV